VQLFRVQLKRGAIETRAEVPELDLRSLEALVGGLSSEDDAEVIAALDMFEAYEKIHLVPALILYHPSKSVVLRALEVLSASNRADVLRVSARLLRHPDDEVRATALSACRRRPGQRCSIGAWTTTARPSRRRRCSGSYTPARSPTRTPGTQAAQRGLEAASKRGWRWHRAFICSRPRAAPGSRVSSPIATSRGSSPRSRTAWRRHRTASSSVC
jgi:hypothetical protein